MKVCYNNKEERGEMMAKKKKSMSLISKIVCLVIIIAIGTIAVMSTLLMPKPEATAYKLDRGDKWEADTFSDNPVAIGLSLVWLALWLDVSEAEDAVYAVSEEDVRIAIVYYEDSATAAKVYSDSISTIEDIDEEDRPIFYKRGNAIIIADREASLKIRTLIWAF